MRRKKILDACEPFRDPWPLIEQRGGFVERREIDLDDLCAALPRQRDGAFNIAAASASPQNSSWEARGTPQRSGAAGRWSDGCGWRE